MARAKPFFPGGGVLQGVWLAGSVRPDAGWVSYGGQWYQFWPPEDPGTSSYAVDDSLTLRVDRLVLTGDPLPPLVYAVDDTLRLAVDDLNLGRDYVFAPTDNLALRVDELFLEARFSATDSLTLRVDPLFGEVEFKPTDNLELRVGPLILTPYRFTPQDSLTLRVDSLFLESSFDATDSLALAVDDLPLTPQQQLAAPTGFEIRLRPNDQYDAQWFGVTTDSNGSQLPAGTVVTYDYADQRNAIRTPLLHTPDWGRQDLAVIWASLRAEAPGWLPSSFVYASRRLVDPIMLQGLPDWTIRTGQTVNLNITLDEYLSHDPDAAPIRYDFDVKQPANNVIAVVFNRQEGWIQFTGARDGTATVTATATDRWGQSDSDSFTVTVDSPNRAPVWQQQPADITVEVGGSAESSEMLVTDQDDNFITVSPTSGEGAGGATWELDNVQSIAGNYSAELKVTPGTSPGSFTLTLTASDNIDTAASREVTVTILPESTNEAPTVTLDPRGTVGTLPEPPTWPHEVAFTARATDDQPITELTYDWARGDARDSSRLIGNADTARTLRILRGTYPFRSDNDLNFILVTCRVTDAGGLEAADAWLARIPKDSRIPPTWRDVPSPLNTERILGGEEFTIPLLPYIEPGNQLVSTWVIGVTEHSSPPVFADLRIDGTNLRGTAPDVNRTVRLGVDLSIRDQTWHPVTATSHIQVDSPPDNRPPVIEPIPLQTMERYTTLTVPLDITDPDGDSWGVNFELRTDGVTARVRLNDDQTALIVDRATVVENFTVRVWAIDNSGQDNARSANVDFDVYVEAETPPQIIVTANPQEITAGERSAVLATINDAVGTALDWQWTQQLLNDTGPHGTFSAPTGSGTVGVTGQILARTFWTAPQAVQQRDRRFRLACTATESDNPTVRGSGFIDVLVRGTGPPNSPPIWTSIPDLTLPRNGSVTVQLSNFCSDPDGDAIEYLILGDSNPSGLEIEINGSDWRITHVGQAVPGLRSFGVRAQDPFGARADTTIDVQVPGGPPI